MEARVAKSLHQKTHRKLAPLSLELGISRKRLQKFISGEIKEEGLTLKEYSALKEQPIFEEFMKKTEADEGEAGEFLAIYKIKFHPEKIKFGLDLFYRYINAANRAINCTTGVPYGDSSCHLLAVLKTGSLAHEDKIGLNAYATHWEDVRIDEKQQALWFSVAAESAGGEENFKKVWKDFNLAIESVTCSFVSLNDPQRKNNGSQLKLL